MEGRVAAASTWKGQALESSGASGAEGSCPGIEDSSSDSGLPWQ
ncbi:MAG TPA: hypothetical protein VIG62_11525 [Blastocatellia bacterium]